MSLIETEGLGGYRDSKQTHAYSYDSGAIVLPIAQRTAGHRIILLHGGVGMRRVKWSMNRTGKPPIIPVMGNTSGDTFLSGVVVPAIPLPSRTNDQSYDWSVAGEYVYVQNDPRIAGTDAFPVGQHPFVCGGQAAAARNHGFASLVANNYTGPDPFDTLMTACAERVDPQGDFAWPIMGLPAAFSSTHIIQD